ncbi:hypothetical protein RintRC_3717 [Richelia intracellularis]|nr:hypothetical protein RintRC_3717 [Richelia intracellularis]
MSEVKWEKLNSTRGDKSPKAGNLCGDGTSPKPGGFVLKPADGLK